MLLYRTCGSTFFETNNKHSLWITTLPLQFVPTIPFPLIYIFCPWILISLRFFNVPHGLTSLRHILVYIPTTVFVAFLPLRITVLLSLSYYLFCYITIYLSYCSPQRKCSHLLIQNPHTTRVINWHHWQRPQNLLLHFPLIWAHRNKAALISCLISLHQSKTISSVPDYGFRISCCTFFRVELAGLV